MTPIDGDRHGPAAPGIGGGTAAAGGAGHQRASTWGGSLQREATHLVSLLNLERKKINQLLNLKTPVNLGWTRSLSLSSCVYIYGPNPIIIVEWAVHIIVPSFFFFFLRGTRFLLLICQSVSQPMLFLPRVHNTTNLILLFITKGFLFLK